MHTKVHISYSQSNLHSAARFIWENNSSITKWPTAPKSVFDIMNTIRELMRDACIKNAKIILREQKLKVELSDDWISYTGTGGFYCQIEFYTIAEDEENPGTEIIQLGVQILVDPAIGDDRQNYTTEVIDIAEENIYYTRLTKD